MSICVNSGDTYIVVRTKWTQNDIMWWQWWLFNYKWNLFWIRIFFSVRKRNNRTPSVNSIPSSGMVSPFSIYGFIYSFLFYEQCRIFHYSFLHKPYICSGMSGVGCFNSRVGAYWIDQACFFFIFGCISTNSLD